MAIIDTILENKENNDREKIFLKIICCMPEIKFSVT